MNLKRINPKSWGLKKYSILQNQEIIPIELKSIHFNLTKSLKVRRPEKTAGVGRLVGRQLSLFLDSFVYFSHQGEK